MTAKIEVENTTINNDRITESVASLAIGKNIPLWIVEEMCCGLSDRQKSEIEKSSTLKGECDYLSFVFPELKHKIKYRYEGANKDKSSRSKFRDNLRTLLRCNMENNGIKVRSLTESMMVFLLGYTVDDLMNHLENQITAKMEWGNHGPLWHIDHIHPCAKLKYKSANCNNFKKLWSINNLRPLCKIENLKKGSKLIGCGE